MSDLSVGDILLAAAGGALLGYGAALLSGFYPLAAGAFAARGPLAKALVLLASAAAAALALGLLGFTFLATAWAPALIAAGIALLAGPLLFQALPLGLSSHPAGLAAWLLLASAAAGTLIQRLAA